jgi:repressor LexA
MPLTKRQKEILDYVTQYIEVHGYAPSYREIAEAFKLGSVATVAEHVDTLISKGLLRKNENEARSLQLVTPSEEEFESSASVGLPVLGMIAAGQPIETISGHNETLEVPPFMVGRRHSYVLQVRGESMKDAGIMDGDYVVIQEKPEPSRGDMVVALVNGEATLKRYYKEKDHIRLQPENPTMDPILVKPGDSFEIQGICIGVIRKYQ